MINDVCTWGVDPDEYDPNDKTDGGEPDDFFKDENDFNPNDEDF